MKPAPNVALRLVVETPTGPTHELAVLAPADAPGRSVAAAIAGAVGVDERVTRVVAVRTGKVFADDPLSTLALRQGDEVRVASAELDPPEAAPVVDLTVVEPHGRERTFSLPLGDHLIGRDAGSAAVPVADPTVSWVHARLSVRTGEVWLTDLNSTNGTRIEKVRAEPKNATRLHLPAGLMLGGTAITVRERAAAPEPKDDRPEPVNSVGDILFNRPPRVATPQRAETIALDAAPTEPAKGRIPLATSIVPLVLAGVMLVAMPGSQMYLLFALMSPAIAVASYLEERSRGGSAFRAQSEKFRATVDAAVERVTTLRRDEARRLLEDMPDCDALSALVRRESPGLWARRIDDDDFLRLRIGLGDRSSSNAIEIARGGSEELRAWAESRIGEAAALAGVPAAVDLAACGSVGLVGAPGDVEALARWLVVQAASLHSPRDLAVAAVAGDDGAARWEWLKWLPHTQSRYSPLRELPLAGPGRVMALVADVLRLRSERAGRTMVRPGGGGGAR
ncbi:MAG: FHA domain-containing protein, partial [Candidatus Limnocylindrales bacterium]